LNIIPTLLTFSLTHLRTYFRTYLPTYHLSLQLSESLRVLNFRGPFFPVHCFMSPSFKFHLSLIFCNIFQPSQCRSSRSSSFLRVILLLTTLYDPFLPDVLSILVFSFLLSAPISKPLYSSRNFRSVLILHIPCSARVQYILLSIFFSN
jgi:hypothetical protein